MRRWQGKTAVCIASGPSLTADDCELVRQSGLPTIAVNHSWKLARFADVLYAGDPLWWDKYGAEVDIEAERWTHFPSVAQNHGINSSGRGQSVFNSGYRAIELAISFGAARVILLGYDCSLTNGIHWHGPHEQTTNPSARCCSKWLDQFARLETHGAEVINCSRHTALTCFPRMPLEQALENHQDNQ